MLASQLIYTSWKNGNSTTKGYMVYSKSQDITENEVADILAVMKYNAPSDLPYTPTQEEIDTLFPKNLAYFKLSSGRLCIAQSCYIGQDYTNRWGNYIIHAYVVDAVDDIIPMNLMGSDIFRRCLTEEELNADAAPEFLPKVELNSAGSALSQQDIFAFFHTPEKVKLLKKLVQSAMDAVLNKGTINFSEQHDNLKYWLGALALVMPRTVIKDLYFSTYVVQSSDLITLSCMWPNSNVGAYAQGAMNNVVAIIANQPIEDTGAREFVNNVCDRLISDYYSGILCANEINSQMDHYKTNDCDLIMKLVSLKKGDSSCIGSCSEMHSLLKTLCTYDTDNIAEICENVFSVISANQEFRNDGEIFDVYKLIYPNLSDSTKEDLLMFYVDGSFKKHQASKPIDVYNSIKTSCPCEWTVAIKCFIKEGFMEHLKNIGGASVELFIVLVWMDVYPLCKDEVKDTVIGKIKPIYQKNVAERNTDAVMIILKRCKEASEQAYVSVYKSVTETGMDYFANNIDYLFSYLSMALNNGGTFWTVLCKVIALYPDVQHKCTVAYVKLMEKHPDAASSLAQYATKYPQIKSFIDSTLIYEYENSDPDSADDILDGYNRYVTAEYSNGALAAKVSDIFVAKLQKYLSACSVKEQISDGMYLYEALSFANTDEETVKKIRSLLFEAIFRNKSFADLEKNIDNIRFVQRALEDSRSMNFCANIRGKVIMFVEGVQFEQVADGNKDRAAFSALLANIQKPEFCCLRPDVPPAIAQEFFEQYFDCVLQSVYTLYNIGEVEDFALLLNTFIKPFYKIGEAFNRRFVKCLKKDVNQTNEYMDLYFEYIFNEKGPFRDTLKFEIIEEYLASLGKGKRREVFEQLCESFNDQPRIRKYIKEFNKNHMTLWDKFLAMFASKEKEGDKKNGEK